MRGRPLRAPARAPKSVAQARRRVEPLGRRIPAAVRRVPGHRRPPAPGTRSSTRWRRTTPGTSIGSPGCAARATARSRFTCTTTATPRPPSASRLQSYVETLAGHGLLGRDRTTGERQYGFIHGNWALANCRPGRAVVRGEQRAGRPPGDRLLRRLHFPVAPRSGTSPGPSTRFYYAPCGTGRRCPHESGVPLGTGPAPAERLMLIPGPLMLDWRRRKWGLMPRIENACIQDSQPADIDRLRLWQRARVQVPSRPDWYFVKLHSHGAPEWNQAVVLGEPMRRFHADLAGFAARNDGSRTTTSRPAKCTIWPAPPRPAGPATWTGRATANFGGGIDRGEGGMNARSGLTRCACGRRGCPDSPGWPRQLPRLQFSAAYPWYSSAPMSTPAPCGRA